MEHSWTARAVSNTYYICPEKVRCDLPSCDVRGYFARSRVRDTCYTIILRLLNGRDISGKNRFSFERVR